MRTSILFVCHGNICRSVAAEMICCDILRKNHLSDLFEIDSSAVSEEEIGNPIYPPMRRILEAMAVPLHSHYARRITRNDINHFDYIFIMDESNRRYLSYLGLNDPKIHLLGEYGEGFKEIEDPWYTGRYEIVANQLNTCIRNFLESLGHCLNS